MPDIREKARSEFGVPLHLRGVWFARIVSISISSVWVRPLSQRNSRAKRFVDNTATLVAIVADLLR